MSRSLCSCMMMAVEVYRPKTRQIRAAKQLWGVDIRSNLGGRKGGVQLELEYIFFEKYRLRR